MSFLTVAILLLLLYFVSLALWRRYKSFKLREELGLVGPPADFITGNIKDMIRWDKENGLENSPYVRLKLTEKYGKVIGFYPGTNLELSTTDLEIASEIMIKQFANFVDRPYSTFNDVFPLNEGLLFIGKNGPHGYGWKDIRSIVSPVFTTGKMKLMYGTIHERIETLLNVIEEKIKEDDCIDVYE
uniref:Cytochrome P450 n=1 Tax=Acrobeloides nanus TaxID=290746 RepID=A0A914DE56_9BILA